MQVIPDATTASTATNYLFEFKLDQGAPQDSKIKITFPSEFTLAAGACTLTDLVGINHGSPACTIAGKVATLTSLYTAAQTAGTSIAFKITSNKITNPSSTTSANSILIETRTSGDALIASTSLPNLFPFTQLTSVSISKDSN